MDRDALASIRFMTPGPAILRTEQSAVFRLSGTSVTWSVAGRHYFGHDQIGFSYSGNFAQYSQNAGLSGANNSVAFNYGHYFSRRLSMNLGMSGLMLSQNYALNNPDVGPETTVANVNLGTSPNIQITDNGVKQVSLQGDFVWQQTMRLSFNGGASYFAVERDTPGLQGMTGSQANTDVNYRLTRQMTVGSYYSLSDYVYPHGFGTSTINTFGGIFSYAFSGRGRSACGAVSPASTVAVSRRFQSLRPLPRCWGKARESSMSLRKRKRATCRLRS